MHSSINVNTIHLFGNRPGLSLGIAVCSFRVLCLGNKLKDAGNQKLVTSEKRGKSTPPGMGTSL